MVFSLSHVKQTVDTVQGRENHQAGAGYGLDDRHRPGWSAWISRCFKSFRMSLQNLCWLIFIDCFWCYRGSGTYPLCTGDPHNPWADPMNQPVVQLPGVWWEAHQLSACTGTAKVGNVSLGQSYCAWTGGATGAVWLWQNEEFETLHVECMLSSS